MTKILTGLLAVAMVAVVVVGGAMAGAKKGDSPSERLRQTRRGTAPIFSEMMPEVVSTAEMPRLVMPTVEVNAFRTVALSTPVYCVN